MIGDTPYFDINADGIETSLEGPIKDKEGFYKRVLEFIEFNLTSNFSLDVLCYLVDPGGSVMEAKLEEEGYVKSLAKALEYYKENEEYETCETISKLIIEHGLQ